MKKQAIFAMRVFAAALASAGTSIPGSDDGVRIASFNICHGAPSYTAEVNLEKTAQTIAAMAADFVCLQEVDNGTTRSGNVDETACLAEVAGLHGTFAKAINTYGGEYGVAILSKEAPLSVERVPLPDPAADDGYSHENRVLLACEFTNCIVATAHLSLSPGARLSQIGTITNTLAAYAKPVFFAGDWNALPGSETISAICERFDILTPTSGVVTLNSKYPKLADYCIDYISVDKADRASWYLRHSEVIEDRDTSDHAPILVEVLPVPSPLGWVCESAATTGLTGVWSKPVSYNMDTLTAPFCGYNTFTPATPSSGNVVTAKVSVAFSELVTAEDLPVGAQAAFRLGANNVFQAWTDSGWLDVAADGVTPATGVEYAIVFAVDYRARRYSVFVEVDGEEIPFVAVEGGKSAFALAGAGDGISAIQFMGDGVLSSILGDGVEVVDDAGRSVGLSIIFR